MQDDFNRCYADCASFFVGAAVIRRTGVVGKEVQRMEYKKPAVLAKSTVRMAECRPNSKPSGRPCNPPRPSGR